MYFGVALSKTPPIIPKASIHPPSCLFLTKMYIYIYTKRKKMSSKKGKKRVVVVDE